MSRTLFGPGAKEFIVERIQRALQQAGFDPQGVDGDYGRNTMSALLQYQESYNANLSQCVLPENGRVDDLTWDALLTCPPPSTSERALELTASFEGHGFTLAAGNYDGAWLTWGIIGFTMKAGNVQAIVRKVNASSPECVQGAFGENAEELLNIIDASEAEQAAWADSISTSNGKKRLVAPWNSAFDRFGRYAEVQQVQLDLAYDRYFAPAIKTACAQGLMSELGMALMFDIHVQCGGLSEGAQSVINQNKAATPPGSEGDLRRIIANAVADSVKLRWREQVRRRKLTVANGQGNVHGKDYVLEHWGLTELDAPELVEAAVAAAGGGD